MAQNIEIKAKIVNLNASIATAKALSGTEAEILKQEDYFFHCENGRLKLRIFSADQGELIFYQRADAAGPKTSLYYISPSYEPYSLLEVLDKAYSIIGIVKKTRRLFLIGRTRIHIDDVDALGQFLEFEVVLAETESEQSGIEEAENLLKQFDIKHKDLINCAYIDLLLNQQLISNSDHA